VRKRPKILVGLIWEYIRYFERICPPASGIGGLACAFFCISCLSESGTVAQGTAQKDLVACDGSSVGVVKSEWADVVHVVDGDTLYLRFSSNSLLEKVRLADIDAPECKKKDIQFPLRSAKCIADEEVFGLKAYQFLRQEILDRRVNFSCTMDVSTCDCKRGYYGRKIGSIEVAGVDLSKRLVERGLAFTYTSHFSAGTGVLCRLEREAKLSHRGMWKNVDAMIRRMTPEKRRRFAKHEKRCKVFATRVDRF